MLDIVVIPIYKSQLDRWEEISFRQCCSILGTHNICMVAHKDIDLTQYYHIAQTYNVSLARENFDKEYFTSIYSYSRLMLSVDFYKRFNHYEYMLIYQLDAFVFSDQLDNWCKKGYDYVGAPWFENYGTHEDGNSLWAVGNGGFSLRKISYFLKVLQWRGPVKSVSTLPKKSGIKETIFRLLYSFGYCNSISYFKKRPEMELEDSFFCVTLSNSYLKAYVPSVQEAYSFAFEKSPSYLFSTSKHLPFGCHAWHKHEYDTFWKQYIQ